MPVRRLLIANRHPRLRIDRSALSNVVRILDAHAPKFRGGCPPGELSLVFLTDASLAQLHANFLSDPSETDVITFEGQSSADAAGETLVAGEICVSADAARRQSKPRAGHARREKIDFSEELTLYLVHGWLHLAGYDDLQPGKKRAMRSAEARALKILRAEAKLPRFTFRA
ncbi:MAG: rRNA maturation RNase YbeY [Opitutaceae bacterium]